MKCMAISSPVGLKKKGVVTRAVSAPASLASLVSSMVSRVPMAPVPANTWARPSTLSIMNSMIFFFSSLLRYGASPVLALATIPETPPSTQCSISVSSASNTISPCLSKGVMLGT